MNAELTKEERINLLFEVCTSKEMLAQHIQYFLGIDLPDCIVDEDSNSTPMEFVWRVYRVMLTDEGPHRFVVATCRNGAKTLCACIIRFYGMIHFRRDGTHLAAVEDQSKSAGKYLNKFLQIPEIVPYVKISNTRDLELSGLPANFYTKRSSAVLRIAVATPKGVNSQRGSLNIRDELDLVPSEILSEAAYQADPTQDEHQFDPIEINLSSRKTASGPIQALLNESEDGKSEGLQSNKWSLSDWMKKCPKKVCGSDKPQLKMWLNTETLAVTYEPAVYEAMSAASKSAQKEIMAFEGCRTCPVFMVCQARSVKQTGSSKMLRSISFVSTVLKMVKDVDKIIAQALNWKPERSGTVFKMFTKTKHYLRPIEFYRFITGKYYAPDKRSQEEVVQTIKDGNMVELLQITPSKDVIFQAIVEGGWHINYGFDWGFSPAKATSIVTIYHKRKRKAGVFHVAWSNGHSNEDWAKFVIRNVWSVYPGDLVCPDMADPASPTYFGKLHVPCVSSKPPRIETGVSQIRSFLWDPQSQISRFAILDDGPEGQNIELANSMENWTHKKTAIGFDYDKFEDDDNCDFIDPTRYGLHPFVEQMDVGVAATQGVTEVTAVVEAAIGNKEAEALIKQKNDMKKQMSEFMHNQFGIDPFNKTSGENSPTNPQNKKNGGIKFVF